VVLVMQVVILVKMLMGIVFRTGFMVYSPLDFIQQCIVQRFYREYAVAPDEF